MRQERAEASVINWIGKLRRANQCAYLVENDTVCVQSFGNVFPGNDLFAGLHPLCFLANHQDLARSDAFHRGWQFGNLEPAWLQSTARRDKLNDPVSAFDARG